MTLQNQPRGFYVELSDLIIVRAWSAFYDLRTAVEWDHCVGDEDYEEAFAFYPSSLKFRRWSMWRTNEDIMVQPTVGRAMQFTSVAGALDSLIPVALEAADRENLEQMVIAGSIRRICRTQI